MAISRCTRSMPRSSSPPHNGGYTYGMSKRIDKRILGIMCVIGVAAVAIILIAFWGFGGNSGKKGDLSFALLLTVPAAVLMFPIIVYAIARTRVRVRKPLHPCAECGYELRGIGTGMCPECGTKYR